MIIKTYSPLAPRLKGIAYLDIDPARNMINDSSTVKLFNDMIVGVTISIHRHTVRNKLAQ